MITYGSTTLTSYNSIVETEVYYYKSTSPTALSGGSWSTTKPTWENGKYIWQKIRTIYEDETYTESDPVNITGQQGATGAAAYSYKLNASDTIIGKTKTGEYTIDKITFSATSKQGTSAVTAYSGRFKIETTEDGSTWTTPYTSSANESSKEFTIPENIVAVKCSLYQAGGTTVLLDIVTIPIIKDGVDAIGLRDSIPYYLASDKQTGVTRLDQGWTRFTPQLTTENKYLWVYYVSRYGEGESEPELIEIRDDVVSFENHGDISPVDNCTMIAPAQDLHGYDSPWVGGAGKNIWDGFNGYWSVANGTYTTTASAINYISSQKIIKPAVIKTYTLSTSTPIAALYLIYWANGSFSSGQNLGKVSIPYTFTVPANIDTFAVDINFGSQATALSVTDIQLEEGSTATSWEPYENVCPIEGGFKSNTLLYNVKTTDNINNSDPYLFRPIGNVSENGTQEVLNKIIGGSIVWNQLLDGEESMTLTMPSARARNAAVPGANIVAGHKYLFGVTASNCADITANCNSIVYTRYNNSNINILDKLIAFTTDGIYYIVGEALYNGVSTGVTTQYEGNVWIYNRLQGSEVDGATATISNFQLFDLTQMFGSTIADYIYNLETATTGAGVAWFRKYFPNEYYEYNAGEIMSVEGLTSHDTVGFNMESSEGHVGWCYNSNGTINKNASTLYASTLTKMRCLPNTEYCVTVPGRSSGSDGKLSVYIAQFDIDGNFISVDRIGTTYQLTDSHPFLTFVTGSNTHYFSLYFYRATSIADSEVKNICVNLSWDGERDGEYEPYVKRSYPLDSSLTLRGIPKLSADGKLYYDGDHYKSDGTVERRYGIVDLGTLNWNRIANPSQRLSETYIFVNAGKTIGGKAMADFSENLMATLYTNVISYMNFDNNKSIGYIYTNQIAIRDDSYTDAESFKAAMSGVYLVYELEEPVIETAQPYQVLQNINPYGTEGYITNSIIPVGHETEYVNGNVISVQVPIDEDDLYGGELDLTNGILTINQKLITFNGDSEKENWSSYTSSEHNTSFYITVSDKKIGSFSSFCNSFKNVNRCWAGSDKFGVYSDHNSLPRFYFCSPNNTISTVQEWQTWLSNNPVQLCYEIAIPITYQLTSQEVTMFMGQNNIYNNIGQTKIHYYDNQKSTEPYVDNSHTSTLEIAQAAKEVAEAALSQVDGKIETWCQSTDPATAWTTEDLKNQHDGDLWYYTGESTSSFGNNTTYKYIASNNTWTPYSTNIDLFDRIDSKSTIYYGTTTTVTSAENGDYLVDSENDCTYRWNNGAWVLATDYKQVAIDAVDIGGRNLLRNTTEASSKVFVGSSASTVTYPEPGVARIAPTTSAQFVKFKVDYLDYDDFKDSTVMVSFDARIADVESTYTTTNNVLAYLGVSLASRVNSLFSSSYDRYCSYTFTGLTTEWQRFSHIYSIPDSFTSGKTSALVKGNYLTVEFGELGSRSPIEIRLVKLERGNKATDWTPAPEDVEEEISTLRTDLQSQIDEKIQTFYQSTNPASSWTTTELRTPHDGDLWYYTGTTTSTYTKDNVYRYNASNNTWSVYSASGELFDKVDGKSTIYYGTTSGTYTGVETGDYLVDSTDGSSYRWDGSKWVKVTDYKTTITNAIDDIEIGSRNLIWRSNWENMSGKWSDWGTPTIREIVTINGKKWLHLKTSGSKFQGYSQNSKQRNGYGEIKEGDNITVSFTAYAAENNITACIGMYWLHPTSGIVSQNWTNFTLSTSPTRYSKVFTVSGTEVTGFNIMVGDNSTDIKEIWITDIKVEKGNKATDWSPAPEDTEIAISNVQDTANTALIQSSWYAICDTAGATVGKVATISPATTSFTLREGTTAIIKFVNTNSGAKENLKLNVNDTGEKPIKYIYNGGLTNIPSPGYLKGGQSYQFYYDGTNWVVQMIYNTNTNTIGVQGGTVTAGTNGIRGYTLIMRDTENTWVSITTDAGAGDKDGGIGTNHVKYAEGLYPDSVMYESTQTNYAAGASVAVCYLALALNLRYSTNCGTTLIKDKPVYLVGELHDDGLFYLDDIWWTQTIPITEDGKTYIYLGIAYSTYQIYLATEKPMYQYYDGEFMTYEDIQTALAAKSATNYMSSDNTGIMVANMTDGVEKLPSDSTLTGSNIFITAGYGSGNTAVSAGVHIRDGRTDIAKFGATAQIGRDNEGHVLIDNDSVDIKNGQNVLASFGSDVTIGRQNYHSYLKLDNAATHVYGYDKQEVLTYGTANDPATGLVQITEGGQIGNSEISGQDTYGIALSYEPVQILSVTIDEELINLNEISIDEGWNWVYVTATQGKKMEVVYTTSTNTPFFRLGSYYKNKSYGINSFGAGRNIEVSGANSGGFGYNTVVKGNNSFACGYRNKAKGNNSFVCGENNVIDSTGLSSAIIGSNSKVSHSDTVCMGIELNSTQGNQCIVGTINEQQSHTRFDYFVVGVGDLTDNGGKDGFLVAGADNEYDKGCVGIGLNTSAPSDSTDGQLYRLLQYLGWGDVIF